MLWKCCTQYVSKFGKLSSGHRTGKMSVFIPIPKKGNAKECSNYRTIALTSHTSKSVQFSHSVVSNSFRPHESQHARPPCPSPTSGFYTNSCPLCRWWHPTISSSVVPLSSCPQSFPALGSFPMSQLFTSGGQSIGVSASTSVFPLKTQGWSPSEWTGWISLQSKGLSRIFSNIFKSINSSELSFLHSPTNSHIHTWHWKNHSLD